MGNFKLTKRGFQNVHIAWGSLFRSEAFVPGHMFFRVITQNLTCIVRSKTPVSEALNMVSEGAFRNEGFMI